MHRKAVYGHVMDLLEDRDGPQQSCCRDLRSDRGWERNRNKCQGRGLMERMWY